MPESTEISKMEILVTNEDVSPQFLIQEVETLPSCITVNVFEVTTWSVPGDMPGNLELYCHAYLKWDGCHHVWFGKVEEDGNRDGYLHLCGIDSWKDHIKMMEALYRYAEKNIQLFDDSEKWDKEEA